MQTQFHRWTTQYTNYLESAMDDSDPIRLTYAQWFNTRRHVTEYPRRREYVWLEDKDNKTQQNQQEPT